MAIELTKEQKQKICNSSFINVHNYINGKEVYSIPEDYNCPQYDEIFNHFVFKLFLSGFSSCKILKRSRYANCIVQLVRNTGCTSGQKLFDYWEAKAFVRVNDSWVFIYNGKIVENIKLNKLDTLFIFEDSEIGSEYLIRYDTPKNIYLSIK